MICKALPQCFPYGLNSEQYTGQANSLYHSQRAIGVASCTIKVTSCILTFQEQMESASYRFLSNFKTPQPVERESQFKPTEPGEMP